MRRFATLTTLISVMSDNCDSVPKPRRNPTAVKNAAWLSEVIEANEHPQPRAADGYVAHRAKRNGGRTMHRHLMRPSVPELEGAPRSPQFLFVDASGMSSA